MNGDDPVQVPTDGSGKVNEFILRLWDDEFDQNIEILCRKMVIFGLKALFLSNFEMRIFVKVSFSSKNERFWPKMQFSSFKIDNFWPVIALFCRILK